MSEGLTIVITERGGQLVAQRFDQLDERLRRLGNTGGRTGSTLRALATKDIGILTGAMGKLSALAGGLGFAKVAKETLDWSRKLGDLQVEARATNEEMRSIQAQLLATAQSSGVMADELADSLLKFQTYGGILDKGRKSLGDIVTMHKATGASMEDLTSVAAVLFKTMTLGPEEAKKAFAEMRAMSIAGTITIKGQAQTLPGLLALTGHYGYKGLRGVRQMAGIQQVLGESTGGNAGETSTMVQALFRSLGHYEGALAKAGLDVRGKDGSFKDIGDIMLMLLKDKRIVGDLKWDKKTQKLTGGRGVMAKLFPREALVAASSLRNQYDPTTGTWRSDSNMNSVFGSAAKASWSDIERDAKIRKSGAGAAGAAIDKRKAQLDAWIKGTGMDVAGFAMENPGMVAGLLGAGYLGIKSAPWLTKKMLGKGGVGSLGGAAGATPVFVTNMPGSGLPGAPGGSTGGGGVMGFLAKAFLPAAIGNLVGKASASVMWDASRAAVSQTSAALEKARALAKSVGLDPDKVKGGSLSKVDQATLGLFQKYASGSLDDAIGKLTDKIGKLDRTISAKDAITIKNGSGIDGISAQHGRGQQP